MKYIIQTDGTRIYYLCQEGDKYRWRHGRPAFEKAVRFDSAEEAAAAIREHNLLGAGAGFARVQPVEA
jgi:hypothetical protein